MHRFLFKNTFISCILLTVFLAGINSTSHAQPSSPDDPSGIISSQKLPIRGRALFTYLGFKVYRAVLYAKPGETDLLSDTPKALLLLYLRNIKKEQIIKAATKNLKNNPEVNYAQIRDRVTKLNLAYEDVHSGDRYALVYENKTTSLYFNGTLRCEIKGEDFAKAYFGIWLSEHSINNSFKDKLLNQKSNVFEEQS